MYPFRLLTLLAATSLLAGCGLGTVTTTSAATAGSALSGHVFGGQQPIVGATLQLYAVGTAGNGSPAAPILTLPTATGPGGGFTISNDYTCPSAAPATPVYLVATGGNPGLPGTVDNLAAVEVVALGPCNALTSGQIVNISETTTVAAAWALAPFAKSVTGIGSTSTNTAGIANAFLTAAQLADPVTGNSPGASAPANAIIESAKLYSLADILSTCINSTGTDTNCSTLFTDVTPPSGTRPTDTFAAALAVVQNPGNNVPNIFNDSVGSAPPFPALAQSPNDWTMSITYPTDSGPLNGFLLQNMDAQGNFWGYINTSTVVASFNRQFAPLVDISFVPYTNGSSYGTTAFTFDPSNNLWIINNSSTNSSGAENYDGSLLELNSSQSLISGDSGYLGGGVLNPQSIQADTNGNIWVGNSGTVEDAGGNVSHYGGDVALFDNTGTALSPATGFAVASDFQPLAIALDANHTAWFNNNAGNYLVSITTPTKADPTPTINKLSIADSYVSAVAVDTSNQVWYTSGQGNVAGFNHLGIINNGMIVNSSITGGGLIDGQAIAIDPANNIWVGNTNDTQESYASNDLANPVTISQFSGAPSTLGKVLSPPAGFGTDPNVCTMGLATVLLIDSSGSFWVNAGPTETYETLTYCQSAITTFVGLATPTKTPNIGPPQAP